MSNQMKFRSSTAIMILVVALQYIVASLVLWICNLVLISSVALPPAVLMMIITAIDLIALALLWMLSYTEAEEHDTIPGYTGGEDTDVSS